MQKVIVARAVAPLHPAEVEFEAFLAAQTPMAKPAGTGPDDPASGSTPRAPPAAPRARCTRTPIRTGRPSSLGQAAILGLTERDVCFSAAKLFFAYGLGNALTFPMSVGATTLLMGERPTPDATFKALDGRRGGQVTVFFGAPTGFAGMLASPNLPEKNEVALRLVSSAGEALPAEIGERFKDHFGVDIVDGIGSTEMLHIFISNRPDRVRYGSTGWPVPGYGSSCAATRASRCPDGEPGDLYIHGPSAAMMYWGNRQKTRDTFQGGWTKSGDKVHNPATPMAATPTAAAATTCSRSAASTSRPSRWRRRWCSTRRCWRRR